MTKFRILEVLINIPRATLLRLRPRHFMNLKLIFGNRLQSKVQGLS